MTTARIIIAPLASLVVLTGCEGGTVRPTCDRGEPDLSARLTYPPTRYD